MFSKLSLCWGNAFIAASLAANLRYVHLVQVWRYQRCGMGIRNSPACHILSGFPERRVTLCRNVAVDASGLLGVWTGLAICQVFREYAF